MSDICPYLLLLLFCFFDCTISTQRSPGALQWGKVPKPAQAPSGVWTENLPILFTTINPLGHSYFAFSCWYTTLVVLDGKSLQEYPAKAGVLHGCSFPLFLLYIHDLLDVIYNIAISVDNATHYSKYVRHLICGNN